MKYLFILLLILTGCKSYENPVFVVIEIGLCHDNGLCMYKSIQNNGVLTYCNKYQLGDTIPNVANYVLK